MIHKKELDLLFKTFFTLNALRNICLFFTLPKVASTIFYMTYLVSVLIIVFIILEIFNRPIRVSFYSFTSVTLVILLLLIPLSYDTWIWTANSYMALSFFMTMLLFVISRKVIISSETIHFISLTYIVQALVVLYLSLIPSSFEWGALVLHLGNPNQTSILLCTILSFSYIYLNRNEDNIKFSICLKILIAAISILIILTKSRAGILFAFICIAGYLWIRKYSIKHIFAKIVQCGILITPIIFPIIILVLNNVLPNETMIFGKPLFSGREPIWSNIIEKFFDNPFSHHLNLSPFYLPMRDEFNLLVSVKAFGAHNGILAIQWYYGFIVLVLVLIVIGIQIIDLKKIVEMDEIYSIVYIVILATLFSLSFEEAVLMGNICTTMNLIILFIIGRSEKYNDSKSISDLERKENYEE